MFHAVRLPTWGISLGASAEYYGYRWGFQIGPWLVFAIPVNN